MPRVPVVDQDACIGCEVCTHICPQVFKMKDNHKSEVINPTGASESKIEEAMDHCPVACIHWEE